MDSCTICQNDSKYKCPTCLQPYCSVSCCKKHKESPCSAPPKAEDPPVVRSQNEYDFPTEDTVPLERLQLLEKSKELKNCLYNPHLRHILETLDKAEHPDLLMQSYMQEPIFTEFVDECLKIVQPAD